jgi:hypothetical protein
MNIGPHTDDDLIESYLMRRLAEEEVARVEEHLLVCPMCQHQTEEMEEFILVTRSALPDFGRKPPSRALHIRAAGILHSWSGVLGLVAVLTAFTAGVFVPFHRLRTDLPPSEINLHAMRGPGNPTIHVQSGHKLLLNLDTTELPSGDYAVQVVDSSGTEVWSGPAQQLQNPIRANVGRSLRPGRYWVRLLRGEELVREYGLEIG